MMPEHQGRAMSTSRPNRNQENSSSKHTGQTPKPTPSLKGMLWHAIKADTKRAMGVLRNTRFKDVMRNNPGEAFGAIVA